MQFNVRIYSKYSNFCKGWTIYRCYEVVKVKKVITMYSICDGSMIFKFI